MLRIRLARAGRKKLPFFRIVLTEHTKPVHAGYTQIFGWFDPMKHQIECDFDAVKKRIGKGAKPSNRLAKLLFKESQDVFFQSFIETTDRVRAKKKDKKEKKS